MTNIKDIIRLHKKVFRLFDYEHDIKNYQVMEHWQSHAHKVNEGKRFTDDCDGFAMTCCELMIEMGIPKEDILFIVCETETGEGHAVAGVHIANNTYILENRFPRVYDWRNAKGYKWNFKMSFDEPGQWKSITNDRK